MNGSSQRRFAWALGFSGLVHLTVFSILPPLESTPYIWHPDANFVEVQLLDPESQEIEQQIPSSEGFISITEEQLPGDTWNVPAGFSLFDPPPQVVLPKTSDADTQAADYPGPPVPQPLVPSVPPPQFTLSTLPKGLLEGTAPPSQLSGTTPKVLPGTLTTLPPDSKATPRDFPSALTGFNFANVEGPVATRVIQRPPAPKVDRVENITIQLKFWVRPDGRVGNVIPVQKGDAALERVAIEYVQKWRFSPLPKNAEQINQWGLITITFQTQ